MNYDDINAVYIPSKPTSISVLSDSSFSSLFFSPSVIDTTAPASLASCIVKCIIRVLVVPMLNAFTHVHVQHYWEWARDKAAYCLYVYVYIIFNVCGICKQKNGSEMSIKECFSLVRSLRNTIGDLIFTCYTCTCTSSRQTGVTC